MKARFSSEEKLILIFSLVCLCLFVVALKLSGLSVDFAVNSQNYVLETALLKTSGMSVLGSLLTLLAPFAMFFISLVFLVLGLSLLSAFGYFKPKSQIGIISAAACSALALFMFSFSFFAVFLAIGLLIAGLYIIPLSNTYSKELKKWVWFRTGARSVSRMFFIINILIALGIFFSIMPSSMQYKSNFEESLKATLEDVVLGSLPSGSMTPQYQAAMKQKVDEQVAAALMDSPIMESYFRWLPLVTAVGVWIVLEFLRAIAFSNIGGVFTCILIRLYTAFRIKKEN